MRKRTIGALTVGVLLLVAGLRSADLWMSRSDRLADAETRAASQALLVSEHVASAFAAGDASLRQLALHSQRIGGPDASERDWMPSLISAGAGLPAIGSISVTDAKGIIRYSTLPDIVGQSRADLVRDALKAPGDDLVVGTPVRRVIEARDMVIPIARRLVSADGRIDGAVVASFMPSALRPFVGSVDVGSSGEIWGWHHDGTVLFHYPEDPATIGTSGRDHPAFVATRTSNEGVVRSARDGSARMLLSAFRTRESPRLIVAVSIDEREVLLGWRRNARAAGVVLLVVAGVFIVTLLALFRQMDAKATAERTLEQSRELEAGRLRDANERLAEALQREQAVRHEAETASALKDQFLMTVSHELRTPLTAIAGWARLLVDGLVGDERKDAALRTIERNAQTQTRLIDDLLDVSSITSGKMQLDAMDVRIADVMQASADAMKPVADAKNVRLEVSIDPGAGVIAGDQERLQQVVSNLLSNAVKFTSPGGHVWATAVRTTDDVEITVSDTGIGIAPEFLPYVFDCFRQADARPSRRYGGLGLGLSIVRSLVELHGGSVNARSEGPNQGAVFTVRLPLEGERPPAVAQ